MAQSYDQQVEEALTQQGVSTAIIYSPLEIANQKINALERILAARDAEIERLRRIVVSR